MHSASNEGMAQTKSICSEGTMSRFTGTLLHEASREGFEDAKAGRTSSADEWITALRARL